MVSCLLPPRDFPSSSSAFKEAGGAAVPPSRVHLYLHLGRAFGGPADVLDVELNRRLTPVYAGALTLLLHREAARTGGTESRKRSKNAAAGSCPLIETKTSSAYSASRATSTRSTASQTSASSRARCPACHTSTSPINGTANASSLKPLRFMAHCARCALTPTKPPTQIAPSSRPRRDARSTCRSRTVGTRPRLRCCPHARPQL